MLLELIQFLIGETSNCVSCWRTVYPFSRRVFLSFQIHRLFQSSVWNWPKWGRYILKGETDGWKSSTKQKISAYCAFYWPPTRNYENECSSFTPDLIFNSQLQALITRDIVDRRNFFCNMQIIVCELHIRWFANRILYADCIYNLLCSSKTKFRFIDGKLYKFYSFVDNFMQ